MRKRKNKTKASFTRQLLRILTFLVTTVILLVGSAHLLLNLFENQVCRLIVKRIEEKTAGAYSITFERVDLDLLNRSIMAKNLVMTIRSSSPKRKKLTVVFPFLEVTGISLTSLVLERRLDLEEAVILGGSVTLPGEFYRLTTGDITISRPRSAISISRLELLPAYEKYGFARQWGSRIDRLSLKINYLFLKKIDFKALFLKKKKRKLLVEWVYIKRPELEIFRDKNVPLKTKRNVKKMPQAFLRDMGFKFKVERLDITGGHITYSEHAELAKQPGKISFSCLAIHLANIANDEESLNKRKSLVLRARAKVMDWSNFTFTLDMPLYHPQEQFTFAGSLGKIPLARFASILENNAHLRVESGLVKHLEFSAKADARRALGEMKIDYENLKVSLLKKTGNFKKKKFLSFVANLMIRRDNPKRGKTPRIGVMSYTRKGTETFLSYLWKTLLTGFKSSAGL